MSNPRMDAAVIIITHIRGGNKDWKHYGPTPDVFEAVDALIAAGWTPPK